MDKQKLTRRISALKGGRAELVIRNARVVNVFTDTIEEADVGIADGVVLGVGGDWQGEREIDAAGSYLAPGLIDGHMHIESSMAHPA
ncbi:MAG: adenine deaminase, partial [Firmicutes bacterium]|nr:adenine deaminase [Bacillota bacterium]